MADQFVGEIRIFSGNFAPTGWAFCDGQILPISQNTALFSLLGTNYGGNGTSNFALPNFQGAVPISQGQGPGLSPRNVGEIGGKASVVLAPDQMPAHTHVLKSASSPDTGMPGPTAALSAAGAGALLYRAPGATTTMSGLGISTAGESAAHNNFQPYLTLNFIIALQGIYPPHA